MNKFVRGGLLAAFVLSLSLPMAQAQTVSTREVIMGAIDANTSVALPQLDLVRNGHLDVTLLNPTPNPMTFSSPDLSMNVVVPPNSQQVIHIDPSMTASLTPGQQVAYYITDASGNRLASSYFVNGEQIAINTSTTQTEQISQSTSTSEEVQSESTEVVPERQSTVRGFW